jgi:hypothetical protein
MASVAQILSCADLLAAFHSRGASKRPTPAFIVCDANGQALAYVYFEDEPGLAAHLLTRDEARGANIESCPTLGGGDV